MKPRSNPFAAVAIALVSATTLHATPYYWDGTDTTAAVADANGGAGAWDTTLTNWNTAATAGSAIAWPSTGSDNDAVFGGTAAGIVTVDAGGVTVNDITFSTAGYDVTGGALTLSGAPVVANAVNATISSSLSGTSGLTKSGAGTLTLSGTNTGLSGTLTLSTITGAANAGINLSGADADGGLTQIDVNGGGVVADGSYLGLINADLGSGLTINLTGQGGNSTPGTLRGLGGASVVNGPVNINSPLVRISNYTGGTSLTLNGKVTNITPSNGCFIRFANSQGVILTNTANSWAGTTVLGEGSLYCYPGALPAASNLQIGGSNPADFGTNGTFDRALGTAAGQVQFGRANDGQRAMGFSARGGDLSVNLGGSAADIPFLNTYAKTGATNATVTVTLTDATNIVAGMSVTGSGIPTDTVVSSVSGTTVTLNKAATTTVASNALTFYTALVPTRLNSSVFVLNGANADSALTLVNPLDLNGFTRLLQTSANTATLTGGLKNSSTTAASARKTGAGTLVYDPGAAHTVTLAGLNTNAGTLEIKSGTIVVASGAGTSAPEGTTGFIVSRGGTFRLNGGTVNCTVGTYAIVAGNTGGGSSNFILDSGTFNADGREVLNAYGAVGTTTINGGLFVCQGFKVSQNTGILNLNGGILRTTNLYNGGSTVNFNGGTLQAKAASTPTVPLINTSVTTAQIQAGGAVIDSNGFAITIPKLLTEDSGSPGGGLTKKGTGILDLTVDNTYTGTNLIQGGVLRVSATTQLGVSTAPVTVDGGEFGVSGTGIPSISSLARTFTYTTGGFHVGDVTHTLDVDIALTGSAALSKSGPGTIKLSGANTFTGGISMGVGDNGWIEVDSATDLGTGAKIANFISSGTSSVGGIRVLNNVTVSGVDLNLAGRNVSAATQHALLNVSGNNTWAGNINIVTGGGTYYLRSDLGRLELSGTLSNAQPANATSDIRLFNLEGAGDFLISGTIADGANANRFTGLLMEGAGTATLTGTNTYTGPTSVKTGTLALVGGSQASPITVDSGATLGFTLGSPVTSSSTVAFSGATAKVKVTGTPAAATLMTATSITGIPVLDPAIPGYVLAIEGGGTQLNLKSASVSNNYDTWATTNGVSGQAANLDHDNDGVSNGVEYFIGGPSGNTTGFTALPAVTTTAGVSSVTWTKATDYTGNYGTDYVVETSATLVTGDWATEASPGNVTVSGNFVTYTFPAGPVKKFARLKVTGP